MSRNTKTILGILAAIVGICLCCACALLVMGTFGMGMATSYMTKNMTKDPQKIQSYAGSIADFDLPEGYHEEMGVQVMGFTMAGYRGPQEDSNIMLMQYPTYTQGADDATKQQLEQMMQAQTIGAMQFKEIERKEITIRDKPATLVVSQAEDKDKGRMQMASTTFEGKNGLVLLLITGRESEWDQAAVDAFLSSIR